jgi:hypothetical protein
VTLTHSGATGSRSISAATSEWPSGLDPQSRAAHRARNPLSFFAPYRTFRRCDQWWKANEAGLSPAETDKLQSSESKWVCPKCKEKKKQKKAKKRARESERGDSPEAKPQARFKIKLGGFG